jgi:hypothetical protein
MHNGAIVAEMTHDTASEEAILSAAVGEPVGANAA